MRRKLVVIVAVLLVAAMSASLAACGLGGLIDEILFDETSHTMFKTGMGKIADAKDFKITTAAGMFTDLNAVLEKVNKGEDIKKEDADFAIASDLGYTSDEAGGKYHLRESIMVTDQKSDANREESLLVKNLWLSGGARYYAEIETVAGDIGAVIPEKLSETEFNTQKAGFFNGNNLYFAEKEYDAFDMLNGVKYVLAENKVPSVSGFDASKMSIVTRNILPAVDEEKKPNSKFVAVIVALKNDLTATGGGTDYYRFNLFFEFVDSTIVAYTGSYEFENVIKDTDGKDVRTGFHVVLGAELKYGTELTEDDRELIEIEPATNVFSSETWAQLGFDKMPLIFFPNTMDVKYAGELADVSEELSGLEALIAGGSEDILTALALQAITNYDLTNKTGDELTEDNLATALVDADEVYIVFSDETVPASMLYSFDFVGEDVASSIRLYLCEVDGAACVYLKVVFLVG